MANLEFQLDEVCALQKRFFSSSKGTCILSIFIILPSFIKISPELFGIIEVKTNTQRQTLRHIHADENNTCPKTNASFFGYVKINQVGEFTIQHFRASSRTLTRPRSAGDERATHLRTHPVKRFFFLQASNFRVFFWSHSHPRK